VFSRRRRRHAVTDAAPFILTACGQDERLNCVARFFGVRTSDWLCISLLKSKLDLSLNISLLTPMPVISGTTKHENYQVVGSIFI